MSKNLEISFGGQIYQLQALHHRNRLPGNKVTVMRTLNGELVVKYNEELLDYKTLRESVPLVLDSKQLTVYQEKKKWKPSKSHPWKRGKLKHIVST